MIAGFLAVLAVVVLFTGPLWLLILLGVLFCHAEGSGDSLQQRPIIDAVPVEPQLSDSQVLVRGFAVIGGGILLACLIGVAGAQLGFWS